VKKLLLFLIFSFVLSTAWADDTFFGGVGDTIFPSNETKVRMVSENVSIKIRDNQNFVTCDFEFINPGNDTEITMGFPAEPYEDYDPETEKSKPDLSNLLIKNFTVFVDGQKISCELKKLSDKKRRKELDIDYAYLWKVQLPQNKIVKLHHTYDFGNSGDSGGQSWITYILKTGALWDGLMDKAQIAIDLGAPVGKDNLKITPKGYVYKDGIISWSYTHFKPTVDIRVDINPEGKKLINLKEDIDSYGTKTLSELRILRNTVYAVHGKIFKAKDLNDYFSKQYWYQPNPNYTDDLLDPDQVERIKEIEQLEKEKQGIK
jgi:hypothetical protein